MINTSDFRFFLEKLFSASIIKFYDFGNNFQADVDCLQNGKLLAFEVSDDFIKIDEIDKEPSLDFSLYKFYFSETDEAKTFVAQVILDKALPDKK